MVQTETRRQYIARRIGEGATQVEIAGELGVTKQRVHQIVSDFPVPCRCGCGQLIPVAAEGRRDYLPNHRPVAKCRCGGHVTTGSIQCEACYAADSFAKADLTGKTFGSWSVLGLVYPVTPARLGGQRLWWCRCGCGKIKPVWGQNLKRGLSSGCHQCGIDRREARRRRKVTV